MNLLAFNNKYGILFYAYANLLFVFKGDSLFGLLTDRGAIDNF